MDVIIRGMDMPKSCLDCPCCDKNTDNCLLQSDEQNELSETWEDQKSKCPLISLTRCKDCKYFEHWYRDKGLCSLWYEDGIDVFEDGFCSYGKKMDGKEE